MRHPIALAALFALTLCSPAFAAPSAKAAADAADPQVAAVNKVMDLHVEHFNSGNWGAMRAEFASDARLMHQFSPDAIGPDSIASLFREDFQEIAKSKLKLRLSVRVDETQVHGPWAFYRGVYTFTASDSTGKSRSREVRFLEILNQQTNGEWKIARSMDNTSEWPFAK
jgi:ketosteroid isomerase-like protein